MARTRREELDAVLKRLQRETGVDFEFDFAYDGIKLVRNGGSHEVSERMYGTTPMKNFIHALLKGIEIGRTTTPTP